MPQPIFNLDYQYQQYLQRMKLNEATMFPEQKRQIKQTFYGACGQILMLLQEDIGALPDEEAVEALHRLIVQVDQFWIREGERYKARNQ